MLLGRGEEKTGGRQKHAILADSFEALIAAIYLDGGIEAAREFILSRFGPLVAAAGDQRGRGELHRGLEVGAAGMAAGRRPRPAALPRSPSAEGPDHRKRFDVEVLVGGQPVGARERAVEEGSRAAGGESGAGDNEKQVKTSRVISDAVVRGYDSRGPSRSR